MKKLLPLVVILLVLTPRGGATQAPAGPQEAAAVSQGQALLAKGDFPGAAAIAFDLLKRYPGSVPALGLAVDVDLARTGWKAALATYERWSSLNRIEEPASLHRIARAALRDAVSAAPGATARLPILQALADDGDPDALAALVAAPGENPEQAAPLASDRAVSDLIAQLDSPISSDRKRAILGLAATRSRRAVTPLIDALRDPNPDIRAAAAKSLGDLDARQAIGPLKLLLDDPVFPVHYAAAAALFALKDTSGLLWLRQLARSPQAGIRLAAVQAMRTEPDSVWIGLVRDLARDHDSEIRRQAAELLAPHDADGAKAALEPLLQDANVAEREAATASLVRYADTDLAGLRGYLKGGNRALATVAAMRLLELTR